MNDPRERPVLEEDAPRHPDGFLETRGVIYDRVVSAFDAQVGRKPVLADMAKTILANARVLAKALGFDDNPAAVTGAAIAAILHHTKDDRP